MDLSTTGLGSLLNPKTKHQVRVTGLIQKLYEISKFIKDSPVGYKKLIIDIYDRVVLTSLPQKIFSNINVPHPIVKLLTDDIERIATRGDDASYYIVLVSLLLKEVSELMNQGVYSKDLSAILGDIKDRIVQELAGVERKLIVSKRAEKNPKKESVEEITQCTERMEIKEEMMENNENVDKSLKDRKVKSSGWEINDGFSLEFVKNKKLEELVKEAYAITDNVENIRIFKVGGGSLAESYVVNGMIFGKSAETTAKERSNCRTAIYNCPIDISLTETKGNILFNAADDMLNFATGEEQRVRDFVDNIEADVIFCNGNINNVYLDFLNARNIVVFKIQSKFDMMRIREMCGGSIYQRLDPVAAEHLGRLKSIETFYDGSKCYTRFTGDESSIATIVLKESLMVNCDEYERIIENCLKVVKNKNSTVFKAADAQKKALEVLENLKRDCSDQNRIIYKKVARVFERNTSDVVLYETTTRSIAYAFDLMTLLLTTDDYLMAQESELDIKPKKNKNWDDDD